MSTKILSQTEHRVATFSGARRVLEGTRVVSLWRVGFGARGVLYSVPRLAVDFANRGIIRNN